MILPKIEEKNLTDELNNITRAILITKQQLKVIAKSLKIQSKLEKELNKEKIENEIKNIYINITSKIKKEELISLFKESNISNLCSYRFSQDNIVLIEKIKKKNFFNMNNTNKLNIWQEYKSTIISKKKVIKYYVYNYKNIYNKLLLSLACSSKDLNPNHYYFESTLRNEIKTTLLMDLNLKSTKTTLFWINSNIIKIPKDKYGKSKPAKVKKLIPENLSIKEILSAKENKPIEHKVNGKDTYTWIIKVNTGLSQNNGYYSLTHSVLKEELINKHKINVLFLLPETLISIGISFILILFVFNRLLKNIDTLTNTAKQVNLGVKNVRTNVKGKDDIGILGQAFDSMLDFFENSIKILDKKVEEKTKEISKSLEDKELLLEEKKTLLKEIHHRVKNNLALTIGLLQLQEDETEDEKTIKVLTDIQERIYTMELLHRKLYESSNLNKIVLKEYIYDLVNTLSASYDLDKFVKIDIDIEDIEVTIDTAMPFGLIINELVTNAYKYAFFEEGKSNIKKPKLEINIFEKELLTIIVKDNGKGLNKDFNELSKTSLGLELVTTIVEHQLLGTVDYTYENGAKFIIQVDIRES